MNRRIIVYAQYLSDQKRWPEEWALLQQIQPASEIPSQLLLTAGALTGHLDDLIAKFRNYPATAPSAQEVLAVASSLQKDEHRDLALQLEEYEYGRELEAGSPPASAWFGMARVRLEQKRNDDALSLIRNVTLGVGTPFENLPEAVRLLEEQGLKTQAAQYALEWKTAEPWNDAAQLAFARLKADSKLLDSIRLDPSAPYNIRLNAARAMRDLASPVDGRNELSLLTHASISPEQASQPFYIDARLDAARQSSDMSARKKLYQEAIALDPSLRDPRLQLAQAAFASGDDALGLAAFNSFRPQPVPENFIAVEQLAAEAHTRRQQWAAAAVLYRDLLLRVHDAAERAALTKARDSVTQKQSLALANLARRPVVTDTVVQHSIVKPKLKALNDLTASEEEP